MRIDLNKLNTKLNAILMKDLDALLGVAIPGLPSHYTKTELQGWLDKRVNYLNDAKTFTDEQIQFAKSTLYDSLSPTDKVIADAILSGKNYTMTGKEAGYDKLVGLIIYNFITN
jgi:hypothetical protein